MSDIAAIMRGPHIKKSNGRVVTIEPLRVVPVKTEADRCPGCNRHRLKCEWGNCPARRAA
jgi:hypothetical protein